MASATATRGAVQRSNKAGMQAEAFEVDGSATDALMTDGHTHRVVPVTTVSVLDRYSHPLVVESNGAFRVLLIAPLIVWWVAVLAGVYVYEGLPKGQKVFHAMIWFDKGILRPAGPLVPFVVLLLRAIVHAVDHKHYQQQQREAQLQQKQKPSGPAAAARRRYKPVRLGSLILNCLTIYAAMAVARLAIYLTHYFLLSKRLLEFHIVSDHIFLAATMLICLHTEMVCLLSDTMRAQERFMDREKKSEKISPSQVALGVLLAMALLLYLFTAADMYYTAKYYHFPLESVATAVLVFIMFQCPMLVWMYKSRQSLYALS